MWILGDSAVFTSPGMSLELGDNEYGCSSKIALLELEYIRQWLCEAAAIGETWKVLTWLRSYGYPWNGDTCKAAEKQGNAVWLQCCPWNEDIYYVAAWNSDREMLNAALVAQPRLSCMYRGNHFYLEKTLMPITC